MAKKTPFYDAHVKHGGDMVEYAGYLLPVRYEGFGVIAEHKAVRERAGLFDVSHMGEFFVSGENAEAALNYLLSNDIRGMYDGQVRYSIVPNETGGAVDDVLVYRFDGKKFMVVVNGANVKKDADWFSKHIGKKAKFENKSDDMAQLALQGPKAHEILTKLVPADKLPEKYYSFRDGVDVKGVKCLVSRTGYTGEAGYELYCAPKDALKLYTLFMDAGKVYGLTPAGLGCRDALRLEAGMPLYGHELTAGRNIRESGLDFGIKLGKEDFIGKAALTGWVPEYVKLGVKVSKGIAREHDKVFAGAECVGEVLSGTFAPYLHYAIATVRVKKEYADKPLEAEVRGRRLPLEAVPLPFYAVKR
jgi:aminomethyltransferase